MKTPALTSIKEDYLRSIYYLEQKHGRSPKASEIAKYLDLGKSTVSERLQDLSKQKFISYSRYGSIALEPTGREIAEALTTKHRIIEVFLHKILKRPVAELHEEAHKLEHAFSDESIQALKTLLGNPETDPHGKPITYL
jgi:DtxR family transcriptional regulator, Mn-dependent transcriptional regulator